MYRLVFGPDVSAGRIYGSRGDCVDNSWLTALGSLVVRTIASCTVDRPINLDQRSLDAITPYAVIRLLLHGREPLIAFVSMSSQRPASGQLCAVCSSVADCFNLLNILNLLHCEALPHLTHRIVRKEVCHIRSELFSAREPRAPLLH